MSQVMEHIHELATVIGPRPATTDSEALAADYVQRVFEEHGLRTERQEFDCPRTRSWSVVVCYALTVGAAALSLLWGWPALVLAVAATVLLRLELDMRFSLSRLLPKGPSQNLIARHVPNARRGDRLQRVVLVAHYDSPRTSIFASPSLARRARTLKIVGWWATVVVATTILLAQMPFAVEWKQWVAYAALVFAAYPLVLLGMTLYGELLLPAGEGANDNASGIAALVGVMEATVPAREGTARSEPVRRSPEVAREADVVIDDALLEYRPVRDTGTTGSTYRTARFEGFDDIGWESGPLNISSVANPRPSVPSGIGDDLGVDFEWKDAGATEGQERFELPEEDQDGGGYRGIRSRADRGLKPDDPDEMLAGPPAESSARLTGGRRTSAWERLRGPREREAAADRDTLGHDEESRGVRDWLGIGRGFDVRRAGKEIGSWDNIDETDEDDFGFKLGTAGGGEHDFPELDMAARIRRRVTEGVDRALAEKEVWFVATGAAGAGACGMRALLDVYGEELRDALFIVIDGVGSGSVSFVTREGLVSEHRADRRLVAQAKRTARENGLPVTARKTRGVLTDALPALVGGYKAMSVMAFDINDQLPDREWHTDTVESVSEASIDQAITFVTELVRDL